MLINCIESGEWRAVNFLNYFDLNVSISINFSLWKTYGCNVYISSADTTKISGCKQLLENATKFGEVEGIFNLAVILSDHTIENQTQKSFEECLAPKAISTKHLDELSRLMCPNLKYFVAFSSAACGLGNAGQTNYGMANAMMERIIERRVRDHLPGKAIQWGAIGDVGIVAEKLAGNNKVKVLGTLPQRIDNCLAVMDELMCSDAAIVMSMVVPQEQQPKKLDLVGSVLRIIGITDIRSMPIQATLAELGVDSLMNIEIKQMLERDYDIQVSTEDIRLLTVAKLAEISTDKGTLPNVEVETKSILDQTLIEHMGNESTKSLNIIKGNTAAEIADDSTPCVLVIPGIGGVASELLIKFCRRLKMPAFILQLHTTHRMNNVEDVVAHLETDILDLHKKRKRFCIAAYSFGSTIATHVAKLLERESGRHGHIYMIDGSMHASHKLLDSLYGCYRNRADERYGTKIIAEFVRNLSKEQRFDAEAKLTKAEAFDDKVDFVVDLLQTTKYSREYLKECIVGCLNRCAIIENIFWKTDGEKIDADITLIQATESLFEYDGDGIALTTNGKTESISISANHTTILDSEAAIQMIV